MADDPTSTDLVELQNPETGKSHFESYQAQVQALEGLGEQLPALDLMWVPQDVLAMERTIRRYELAIGARLTGEAAAAFAAGLAELRPLAHAIFYAAVGASTDPRAERLAEIMPEATELQRLGHDWLQTLGRIRVVRQEEVVAILKGRGWQDRAGDLQRMSPILRKHWTLLVPLQEVQQDDADKLTLARVDAMATVGTELLELLSGKKRDEEDQIDWRRHLIGLFQLLVEAYHVAREETVAYLRVAKRFDEANAIKSLWAMRRPAKRTPDKGDAPEEEGQAEDEPEATPETD